MRKLSATQKKELDKELKQGRTTCYDIPTARIRQIESLNLFEDFEGDANRYLLDKFFEAQRNKPPFS